MVIRDDNQYFQNGEKTLLTNDFNLFYVPWQFYIFLLRAQFLGYVKQQLPLLGCVSFL